MSRTVRGTELYGSDRCPGSEPLVCIHPSVCCGVQKIEDFWFQSPPQDVKWVLLSSSRALKMAMKRAHHKKVRGASLCILPDALTAALLVDYSAAAILSHYCSTTAHGCTAALLLHRYCTAFLLLLHEECAPQECGDLLMHSIVQYGLYDTIVLP